MSLLDVWRWPQLFQILAPVLKASHHFASYCFIHQGPGRELGSWTSLLRTCAPSASFWVIFAIVLDLFSLRVSCIFHTGLLVVLQPGSVDSVKGRLWQLWPMLPGSAKSCRASQPQWTGILHRWGRHLTNRVQRDFGSWAPWIPLAPCHASPVGSSCLRFRVVHHPRRSCHASVSFEGGPEADRLQVL